MIDNDLPFDPDYTPTPRCERCGLDEFDAAETPCFTLEDRVGSGVGELIEHKSHLFNRELIRAALGKTHSGEF